jgi:hypothetical protein
VDKSVKPLEPADGPLCLWRKLKPKAQIEQYIDKEKKSWGENKRRGEKGILRVVYKYGAPKPFSSLPIPAARLHCPRVLFPPRPLASPPKISPSSQAVLAVFRSRDRRIEEEGDGGGWGFGRCEISGRDEVRAGHRRGGERARQGRHGQQHRRRPQVVRTPHYVHQDRYARRRRRRRHPSPPPPAINLSVQETGFGAGKERVVVDGFSRGFGSGGS